MSTPVDNPVEGLCISASPTVENRRSFVDRGAVGRAGYRVLVTVEVEVRRSARRRRTVSAYRDGERIIVLIPNRFTHAEEAEWVAKMVARLDTGTRRRGRRGPTDAALGKRAAELSAQFLGGQARPHSVRWVANMRTRWASCTPADRTIRMSDKLRELPAWVQDYVLLHELSHLLVPGHGRDFWALVKRYPRTERARGFLDGVSAAAHLPISDDLAGDLSDDPPDDVADDLEPGL
jgi:predicted metal-dependent hydrolase